MRGFAETPEKRRRGWPFVPAILLCFFVGFYGWAYQGYVEDDGSPPTQSWPFGVGGYLLGGVLTLIAIHRARPGLTTARLVLTAICLAIGLVAAAFGALDAGNA